MSFSGKNLSLTSLQDKWEQLNYNLTLLTLYSPDTNRVCSILHCSSDVLYSLFVKMFSAVARVRYDIGFTVCRKSIRTDKMLNVFKLKSHLDVFQIRFCSNQKFKNFAFQGPQLRQPLKENITNIFK